MSIFLFFISAISGCVSISAFASLVGVPESIANAAVGLKICAITAGIKKYKSTIKKKKKKHNEIMLLAKTKLNTMEGFWFLKPSLTHNHDELVNNVTREYDEMKEEIKNPENVV